MTLSYRSRFTLVSVNIRLHSYEGAAEQLKLIEKCVWSAREKIARREKKHFNMLNMLNSV